MGSQISFEGSHLGRASHMADDLFYLTEHVDGFWLEVAPPCEHHRVATVVAGCTRCLAVSMDYMTSFLSLHMESEQARSRKQS